ncbi:MAG: hypothetical protein JOZ96_00710 [Acidobacteria bacterium]|nr:hypothetical protein [Acidobacteriota bacterium]
MRVRVAFVGFVFFAFVVACPSPEVSAQTRAQGQSRPAAPRPPLRREGEPRESEADANADVSITARVTAESLRFEKVPNPRVEFTGQPRRETVWESERENLPQEVRPGETYRNIGITLHIRSVFADIDRIVAEALGEIPKSEDAQPAPAPPQPPPGASSPPPTESTTPPVRAGANNAAATRQGRGPARRRRGN